MKRGWTPEHKVTVTDAGMVIKIRMVGIHIGTLRTAFKSRQLCIRGQHDDFGPFEIQFEIPPAYSVAKLACSMANNVLRIEAPLGENKPSWDYPKTMLIFCDGCGKHFDIVIEGKGPVDYTCPVCGKIQTFDFEALVQQVIKQSKNLGKKYGRR